MIDHVGVTRSGGILTLVLNRADKKNALTSGMYRVLADAIVAAQEDRTVRVIVLRGDGDTFTAGNDLAEFAASGAAEGTGQVGRFVRAIAENEKPLLAAVQGHAVGIGTTMLLHCDHVLLAEDAVLSTPFVSLGLVPEAASSRLLPERIGYLRAFAMFGLGESIAAQEAIGLGLANAIVPNAELVPAIEAIAARIARQPSGAIRATKRLMRNASALTSHMSVEGEEFLRRLQSPEAREAFMAFAQRRPADFTAFG